MQLNLRDVRSKKLTLHNQQLDLTEIVEEEPSLHASSPITVETAFSSDADEVIVNGQATGDLQLVCSRCLTIFEHPLSVSFEERFTNVPPDDEQLAADSELDVHYIAEDKVELTPYIMENIILELPQFPLCDEHCLGLCPTCGHNRNTEPCACKNEKIDPRWSGLQDLFQS